jgi:hydroxypyruvate isomerase
MRSIATEAMTKNPLRTEIKKLPPQVMPGKTIAIVEQSLNIIKDVGQTSVANHFVVQTLLSGSMT